MNEPAANYVFLQREKRKSHIRRMTPFDIYFVSFETKLNFLLDFLDWTGAISKNASNILNSMILKRTLNQRRKKYFSSYC